MIAAGPLTNILFAVVILAIVYMIGIPFDASRRVERVSANSPAATAGLQPGDVIVAVNLQPTTTFKQVSKAIRSSNGKPVIVSIVRRGKYIELPPRKTVKQNGFYIYGFSPSGIVYKSYGPLAALRLSATDTWDVTKSIGASLGRIVTGSGRKTLSSPVGIVDASSQAVRTDYRDYLEILALISLLLALLNLLPLLPLDGGHILFSLIEGIRGRSVGRAVYERVSVVGIALVLLSFLCRVLERHRATRRRLDSPRNGEHALDQRRRGTDRRRGAGRRASMTLTKTHDVEATTAQIAALASAGCEVVRVAVPKSEDADALPKRCGCRRSR